MDDLILDDNNLSDESKDDTVTDESMAETYERSEEGTPAVPQATFQAPTTQEMDTLTDPETQGWGDDADLLPDGAGGPGNDEWDTNVEQEEIDFGDLRVNMSSQEAEAESFPDLVAGKYRVAIFKIAVKRSTSAKNPGKPMYNITYKVQDGQFKGAQIFGDYICLWEGALYSYSQLIKAIGFPVVSGSNRVKTPAELQGKTLIVRLGMGKANTVLDRATGETKTYDARLQVKGYFPDAHASNATQADSLLP
jgi:hypothetical protein